MATTAMVLTLKASKKPEVWLKQVMCEMCLMNESEDYKISKLINTWDRNHDTNCRPYSFCYTAFTVQKEYSLPLKRR